MKKHKLFALLIFSLLLIFSSCASYKSNFHIDDFIEENASVSIENLDDAFIISPSSETDVGLIFYPGALVNFESYLPLMIKCAEKGIKCFLLKMPSDLAILKISAADPYLKNHPEIKNWYMAGHSLGGAMAASYISKHEKDFKGLILLAAYSTKDISKSNLKVLSIFGSEDGVLKKDKYEKYKKNLPSNFTEKILTGGNHGNFGDYGFQKGDGVATMDATEQKEITANDISIFCIETVE